MLRSVIQIGEKTYVVSLPSEWVRKYGISKGDALEVLEKDSYLVVHSEKEMQKKRLSIDITGATRSIKRILGAAYKAGFDEVEVRYESDDERAEIERTLSVSLGMYHVLEEGAKHLVIKSISEMRYEEFEQALRRMFLLLLQSIGELASLAQKASSDIQEGIVKRDLEINNLADLLRRMLNKKGYAIYAKTPPLYFIIEQLEKIGDLIRDCAKGEIRKTDEKPIMSTQKCLRGFYDLYYGFSILGFDDWLGYIHGVKNILSVEEESMTLTKMRTIAEETYGMNGALLVLKLD